MSSYSAPERLSGSFNSRLHPKKVIATDHTHTSLGVGDVKKAADNAFTGDNSFSGETTFTNGNPVSLMINNGSSTLLFKQSTLDSDPAGSIEFRTADNTNGDLKISAHTL